MNILPQFNLFEEDIFENLGDLERLQLVLGAIDDGKLIAKLYKMRGKGRNDWPCETMWNSFIASFLFEHATVESLLRELSRNKQLIVSLQDKRRIKQVESVENETQIGVRDNIVQVVQMEKV
ncbi:MAG: hypothetical protein R3Y24_07255 [Eubacteriales bacterium]